MNFYDCLLEVKCHHNSHRLFLPTRNWKIYLAGTQTSWLQPSTTIHISCYTRVEPQPSDDFPLIIRWEQNCLQEQDSSKYPLTLGMLAKRTRKLKLSYKISSSSQKAYVSACRLASTYIQRNKCVLPNSLIELGCIHWSNSFLIGALTITLKQKYLTNEEA